MANGDTPQQGGDGLDRKQARNLSRQRNQDRLKKARKNSSPTQEDLSSSQAYTPNLAKNEEGSDISHKLKNGVNKPVSQTTQHNQSKKRESKGSSDSKIEVKADDSESTGKEAGKKIAQKMEEGKFSGFVLALTLAVTKDIIIDVGGIPFDIGTGFLSSIIEGGVELFIAGAIWAIIYYSSKNFFSRWFKKLFVRFVIAFIWGFIPFIEIFPEYTLLVLWIARDKRNLRKSAEATQRELKSKQKKDRKKIKKY